MLDQGVKISPRREEFSGLNPHLVASPGVPYLSPRAAGPHRNPLSNQPTQAVHSKFTRGPRTVSPDTLG